MATSSEPPPSKNARVTIHDLHKQIYSIALPKAATAKTASIPLDTLHSLRTIVAQLLLQKTPSTAETTGRLDTLNSKFDALISKVDLLAQNTNNLPRTFADTLKSTAPATTPATLPATSSGSNPVTPTRNTLCDVILTPLDRQSPAFQAESPAAIRGQLNNLLETLNLRDPPVSDSESSGGENSFLEVRAVAKHRNGDICVLMQSPEQATGLVETSEEWLPLFSSLLRVRRPVYAVVMHRVPTTFRLKSDIVDQNDNDIPHLFAINERRIPGIWDVFDSAFWIGRRSNEQVRSVKKHSSMVLYFTDRNVANACIHERLAWDGFLHRVERFRARPTQCFNCFRFGHLAAQCLRPAVCGRCAGPHSTLNCKCPSPSPCKPGKKCTHIVLRCALRGCGQPHAANSPECPVRQGIFQRVVTEHVAAGPYFPSPEAVPSRES